MGGNNTNQPEFNYPWKRAEMYPKYKPVLNESGARYVILEELNAILKSIENGAVPVDVLKDAITSLNKTI